MTYIKSFLMGKKPLKKVQDNIQFVKKRTNRMAKTTSKNIGKIEKQTRKSLGKGVKTTQKRISKSGKATTEASKTYVTNTGRYINLHKKEIAIGVLTGLVAGTKLKTLANLIFDPSKTEEEIKYKGMGFEDFVKMANEDPNNLSDEDWQNLVSQISRRLERQLRLILDIEDVQNFDLITQLDLAKEKQVFTSDEIDKLQKFRKYVRNPILHAKIDKVKKRDINLIIWTANFVKNLEDEEIADID